MGRGAGCSGDRGHPAPHPSQPAPSPCLLRERGPAPQPLCASAAQTHRNPSPRGRDITDCSRGDGALGPLTLRPAAGSGPENSVTGACDRPCSHGEPASRPAGCAERVGKTTGLRPPGERGRVTGGQREEGLMAGLGVQHRASEAGDGDGTSPDLPRQRPRGLHIPTAAAGWGRGPVSRVPCPCPAGVQGSAQPVVWGGCRTPGGCP